MNVDTVHLDPAVGSFNLGDEIISEAVRREIARTIPTSFISVLPTQMSLPRQARRKAKDASFVFVGGSNLLDPRIPLGGNWKANPLFFRSISEKVVCIGVGWGHATSRFEVQTRLSLGSLLSAELIHSVRDSRTESSLRSSGMVNVINTGCPTLWPLDVEHCSAIPTEPATSVVFTLTARHPTVDQRSDREFIELLRRRYERVSFWPQARFDFDYFHALGTWPEITVLPQTLAAYRHVLVPGATDYVGSRLHGGLLALNHGVRSLILAVDERARSKRKDFKIPCTEYGDLDAVERFAKSQYATQIDHPGEAIDRWRAQFAAHR